MQTITVRGDSCLRAAPDCVEITLDAQSLHKNYARAVETANDKVAQIRTAAERAGVRPEQIKTSAYRVNAEQETVREDGVTREEFTGYRVCQSLILELPADMTLTAAVLSNVALCRAKPRVNVRFKLKDTERAAEQAMLEALDRACRSARLLAERANVRLGAIADINYHAADAPLYSRAALLNAPLARCAAMDLTPEDVEIQGSVTAVWEITPV